MRPGGGRIPFSWKGKWKMWIYTLKSPLSQEYQWTCQWGNSKGRKRRKKIIDKSKISEEIEVVKRCREFYLFYL